MNTVQTQSQYDKGLDPPPLSVDEAKSRTQVARKRKHPKRRAQVKKTIQILIFHLITNKQTHMHYEIYVVQSLAYYVKYHSLRAPP